MISLYSTDPIYVFNFRYNYISLNKDKMSTLSDRSIDIVWVEKNVV